MLYLKIFNKPFPVFLISVILFITNIFPQGKHPYASDQPMLTPQKFDIPGITDSWHITFEPDGKTFYFVTGDTIEQIFSSHFENGNWTEAKEAPFSGKYRIETPRISPDGKKFFFVKAMFVNNRGIDDIYVMDKTETGWGEPKRLNEPVNSPGFDASPSCAANGNLYFFSDRSGKLEIYFAKWLNGSYSAPVPIEFGGSSLIPGECFVAPDESFILFNVFRAPNSFQLYVSFNKQGIWSAPQNLGTDINFQDYQGRPCVSPDGNYLFYTANGTQYQADLKPILENLRYNVETTVILGDDKIAEVPTEIYLPQDADLKFTATAAWLQPEVKGGRINNKIIPTGLKPGTYNAYVSVFPVNSSNPPPFKYSVTLNVGGFYKSVSVKNVKKGFSYKYYEDTVFTTIPDLSKMQPVKTGFTDTIDLSVRNRDTLYAILFEGYIKISKTAVYTFFLSSDDGSKLYIDGNQLINNDGLHGTNEVVGYCSLEEGFHKIKIEFFQAHQGASLEFSYASRDIGLRKKPAAGEILFSGTD